MRFLTTAAAAREISQKVSDACRIIVGMWSLLAGAAEYAPEVCLAGIVLLLAALYWRDHVKRRRAERAFAESSVENATISARSVEMERSLDHLKARILMGVAARMEEPVVAIARKASALKHAAEGGSRTDSVNEILAETAKLEGLIDDFLELGRLECGAIEWAESDVETESLMGRALASAEGAAMRCGIRLQSRTQGAPVRIRGNEERLAQVLGHLLDNAIKFSPRGAVVSARAYREGEEIVFAVKDSGGGMAEAELDRLLENLATIGASFSTDPGSLGLGLGLSICREIIKRHGGRLWAETRAGSGSEFGFALRCGSS